jgi:hypothetical protein
MFWLARLQWRGGCNIQEALKRDRMTPGLLLLLEGLQPAAGRAVERRGAQARSATDALEIIFEA